MFWTGLTMAVAGLVLLAYVGWEFIGTNIVARHHQEQQVRGLQEQWAAGEGPKTLEIPAIRRAFARRVGGNYVT